MQYNHEVIVPNEDLPFKMFLFEGKKEIILGTGIGTGQLRFMQLTHLILIRQLSFRWR